MEHKKAGDLQGLTSRFSFSDLPHGNLTRMDSLDSNASTDSNNSVFLDSENR